MDNIKERIAKAQEIAGFSSRKEFAKFVDIQYPTMNRWIEKDIITANGILKIADKVNISQKYLETGKGSAFVEDVSTIGDTIQYDESEKVQIKYFNNTYGSMGEGGVSYDEMPSVMSFDKDFLVNTLGISSFKNIFIINAIGNSMSPTIKDNSKLFISPFENDGGLFVDGGVYVIYAPQDGYLVKRVAVKPMSEEIVLKSDNRDYDDITLTREYLKSCNVIGRVVGNFRSGM